MHYTRDQLPFTMFADSKVPNDIWGKNNGEGHMHIYRNRLVAGCVDKASFGKHGLLHVFYVSLGGHGVAALGLQEAGPGSRVQLACFFTRILLRSSGAPLAFDGVNALSAPPTHHSTTATPAACRSCTARSGRPP